MSSRAGLSFGLAVLLTAACRAPDPRAELEVVEPDAYFVLDTPSGDTQYLAPAVRFHVRNRAARPVRSIQANAVFRRVGEEGQTWGADWQQVAPAGKPLSPGEAVLVVMKSDGRYYSTGPPRTMFEHKLFRDVKVEVFLRVGSSPWTKMAEAKVERRIGSRSVREGE
jgi:hypothetical protein